MLPTARRAGKSRKSAGMHCPGQVFKRTINPTEGSLPEGKGNGSDEVVHIFCGPSGPDKVKPLPPRFNFDLFKTGGSKLGGKDFG